MTPAVAQQAVESPEEFLARAVLIAHESLDKAKRELEEKTKQIEHLSILMTVNNFLTKHGLPVNQGNKNRLSAKAKALTEAKGYPLERDNEYTFYDC